MKDFALIQSEYSTPEIAHGEADEVLNAVLLSLHIKHGDFFVNTNFGCRLHEIKTATAQDVALAEQHVKQSLKWMIETKLAKKISVSVISAKDGNFEFLIIVDANTYEITWKNNSGATVTPPNTDDDIDKVLSDDATLRMLNVSNMLTGVFASDNMEYDFALPNAWTHVDIIAAPNCPRATVTGHVGRQSLNVGENSFAIIVTAEDGVTTKTYIIQITREEINIVDPWADIEWPNHDVNLQGNITNVPIRLFTRIHHVGGSNIYTVSVWFESNPQYDGYHFESLQLRLYYTPVTDKNIIIDNVDMNGWSDGYLSQTTGLHHCIVFNKFFNDEHYTRENTEFSITVRYDDGSVLNELYPHHFFQLSNDYVPNLNVRLYTNMGSSQGVGAMPVYGIAPPAVSRCPACNGILPGMCICEDEEPIEPPPPPPCDVCGQHPCVCRSCPCCGELVYPNNNCICEECPVCGTCKTIGCDCCYVCGKQNCECCPECKQYPCVCCDVCKIPTCTDATLRLLTVDNIDILDNGVTVYNRDIGHAETSVVVGAATTCPRARVLTGEGLHNNLVVGNNPITITVTAQNGNTQTYTININRAAAPLSNDATLKNLWITVNGVTGDLIEVQGHNQNYQLTFRDTDIITHANIMISADRNHNNAQIFGAIGTHVLAEGVNTFVVTVLAEDGITTRDYTISIVREAYVPPVVELPPCPWHVVGVSSHYNYAGTIYLPENHSFPGEPMTQIQYACVIDGVLPNAFFVLPDGMETLEVVYVITSDNEAELFSNMTTWRNTQITENVVIEHIGLTLDNSKNVYRMHIPQLASTAVAMSRRGAMYHNIPFDPTISYSYNNFGGELRNPVNVDAINPRVIVYINGKRAWGQEPRPNIDYIPRPGYVPPNPNDAWGEYVPPVPQLSDDARLQYLAYNLLSTIEPSQSGQPFSLFVGGRDRPITEHQTQYVINEPVPHYFDGVFVHCSLADPKASMTGAANDGGMHPLNVGENNFSVTVTAEDGVTTETYTIQITRAPAEPITPPDDIETLVLSHNAPVIERPAGTYNISIPSGLSGTVMVNNVNGGQNIDTANDVITVRNSSGAFVMGQGSVALNNTRLSNATNQAGALSGAAATWWVPLFNVDSSHVPITGTITTTAPFRIVYQW